MYPWKDLTLTILITYTSVMVINIYFSEGAWFTKWRNVLSFAFVTGLASLVRHNGFFFTAPLFMLVVLLYKKRTVKALASVALAALVVFLIRVPLYNLIKVTYPHNTYTESVGIPMTILGDVMVKNPQALPPETKEFLNRIASDEQWHKKYIPGYYNTIKHNSNASGIVETIPLETFMKWVLQTCIDANYEAFHAVREVTAIVWNIQKNDFRYGFPIPLVKNELVGVLHSLVSGYMVLLLKIPVISQLFTSIGLLMLLLLLVGIFSLSKNGMAVPLLVVPSICYNLGTMLLLCGPDVRFFHFNVVITLPLLLALFAKISNTLPQTASPGPLGGGQ
jgi:4-amino-4-deoxy-L-arabinose transferase-like glycosyltransferase